MVALCTYNGALYLREQLDSLAAQTRLPDELVVCDDGSTDRTLAILDSFAAAAPFPVRIRNRTRLGTPKNFERAIGLTTGAIIALADQDDVWYPHKLKRLERELARSKRIGLVFSDADVVDDRLRPQATGCGRHGAPSAGTDGSSPAGACSRRWSATTW